MSQLCEIYHVGMRTARDVLKTLAREGYIRTAQRRPTLVIYGQAQTPEAGASREPSIKTILSHRSSILSVYETMALLMPPLFSFSAMVCGEEKMQNCLWILAQEKKPTETNGRLTPPFCMKFFPLPAACCSGTYISVLNSMHRSHSSGNTEIP